MLCRNCGCDTKEAKNCPNCGRIAKKQIHSDNQEFHTVSEYEQIMMQQYHLDGSLKNAPTIAQMCEQMVKHTEKEQEDNAKNNHKNNKVAYRKKWKLAVAIFAVICVLLVPGAYFAYPYIQNVVLPEKQAEIALKKAGSALQTVLDKALLESQSWMSSGKNELKGSFKLDNAEFDGNDYLTNLKVNTVNYDIQVDAAKNIISGTAALSADSAEPALNISFYSDGTTVAVQIPELFAETVELPVSSLPGMTGSSQTQESYNKLLLVLSQLNSKSSQEYTTAAQYVIKDMLTGFNIMVENCDINKQENETLTTDSGQTPVSVYHVTLSQEAFASGVDAAVEAVYSDSQLTSYISLMASVTGYSKDDIKNGIKDAFCGMENNSFTISVDSSNQIIKVEMSLPEDYTLVNGIVTNPSEVVTISAEFIGQNNPYNYIVFDIYSSQIQINAVYDGRQTDKTVTLNKCRINTILDGHSIKTGLSGNVTLTTFLNLNVAQNDLKKRLCIQNPTDTQKDMLYQEYQNNSKVLWK